MNARPWIISIASILFIGYYALLLIDDFTDWLEPKPKPAIVDIDTLSLKAIDAGMMQLEYDSAYINPPASVEKIIRVSWPSEPERNNPERNHRFDSCMIFIKGIPPKYCTSVTLLYPDGKTEGITCDQFKKEFPWFIINGL